MIFCPQSSGTRTKLTTPVNILHDCDESCLSCNNFYELFMSPSLGNALLLSFWLIMLILKVFVKSIPKRNHLSFISTHTSARPHVYRASVCNLFNKRNMVTCHSAYLTFQWDCKEVLLQMIIYINEFFIVDIESLVFDAAFC